MSFNLLVWKWTPDFDTGAKRKKARLKYPDVVKSFVETEHHPAMARYDFEDFERELVAQLGPEVEDGPYILERYDCARVLNLPSSRVQKAVPIIGRIAQKCGLTSAES